MKIKIIKPVLGIVGIIFGAAGLAIRYSKRFSGNFRTITQVMCTIASGVSLGLFIDANLSPSESMIENKDYEPVDEDDSDTCFRFEDDLD